MEQDRRRMLLKEQIDILTLATDIMMSSYKKVKMFFDQDKKRELTEQEKESCEALTARFSRLCDFMFQKIFRTIDQIELVEEGSGIDRLNRMEKRGVISSADLWRNLRNLRNSIAHEYLLEKADKILFQSLENAPELELTASRLKKYIQEKSLQTDPTPEA